MMEMKIRKFEIEDYDEVYQLWVSCKLSSLGKSDSKDEINKFLIRNPETSLVGLVNGKIIASVLGGYDGRRGFIHHLAVEPQYQNKGYGSLLLNYLEDKFKELGVIKISLWVLKSNLNVDLCQ